MRSPAELDDVQWRSLTHAYGSAEDVPGLIRALYEADEGTVDEAIYELYGNIHHQGTVYPASAPAVPFLAHAVRHTEGKRDELLMLLATLAEHDADDVNSPSWSGSSVGAICTELCRVLPDLLPCLEDGEHVVRRAALRVVGCVAGLLPAESGAAVEARLDTLYATDPVPAVRADAMVVLARLGREPELCSPLPEVRLAAAVVVAERNGPPYPAELVEILAEDGAEPDPGDDDFPWSGATTPDQHVIHLLGRDADAGLAVAARWIAAGDLGARGSWLAREIVETWRDREAEVLDLLLTSLPHQKDFRALAHGLRTIGCWIRHLPEPGVDLRDALYRYACTDEEETAAPALLALVRSRDPRALELVPHRPAPQILRAAASFFPEAADRLIPVIRRELAAGATDNAGIALVKALEPFGVAARRAEPELLDCLRTGRAPIVAAHQLGLCGVRTRGTTSLLRKAMRSTDSSLSAAAAVAHHRLTGDAGPALRVFERLLSGSGPVHWHLSTLKPLGSAATPLLPLIEPLLTDRYAWTRMAAAEAHYEVTGSPDRAVPVLVELVDSTPVGLNALKALAATGRGLETLGPTLRSFAWSPLRRLSDGLFSEQAHPDEELRALARKLLAAG
ncbi:hypothetical protein ACIBCO_24410 [Streptomyces violascens]|uniref:hypothetical protein n=1 Tax=Streptomyces violascens TaxID=67381 RepID=UPI0037B18A7D